MAQTGTTTGTTQKKPTGVEISKLASRGLRGGVAAELSSTETRGGVSEDSFNLLKFHGTYEQFDRDTATPRKQAGLDKEWQFMVRVRAPAGLLTAEQYLALDAMADRYSNSTLRVTTRQALQFHGVLRENLKPTIAAINHTLLTTMAACGDVVRNVTTTPAPRRDAIHRQLVEDARMLSERLLPRTRAHHEIFLDEEPVSAVPEEEPLYGATYLPRKFKIGLAHPDDNTADVLTNDLGFIANGDGAGGIGAYQVCIGGGLGLTHNRPDTFPRLASPVTVVPRERLLHAAEAVVRFQRDHGDRTDRRRARLKYVIEDYGLDWVREQLAPYFGGELADPGPLPRLCLPELLGWHAQGDGRFWLGVPVPSGRIADQGRVRLRTALREVVTRWGANPVLTPQQDVILADLPANSREAVESLLREHGVTLTESLSPLARWALACPALPTCGLALTEAERVRDPLVAEIEAALERQELLDERISLRITGCPNGCARPYAGDIGLVGRVPGHFAIFVGGDFEGTRLSFKLHERVPQGEIAARLEPLFAAFAGDRREGEGFGDFCHRLGPDALLALGAAESVPA
ncbi:NADPH-dependent assimilatory sulfite reductase hemoprotein subunit [Roseomonas mucosa]|uniref:NADPH-dependent assimilatory sulfite reductase hemoprotein subunit n=1 Tax=Roseomonas mucosa TaxID=207340 RepID=UPI0028CBE9F6|nr:NADPH-dependent assimilatory sulfite reductase hemoprotein subunit [Roseomonas mucosa]MDT8313056.1 NADPH-dependent assimilatory sulfite reductase hemoprotein subunit [Roseomonas mucosa]MDT8360450.1 NADPH-dependent assimilatory sulfite reductase hemoprotein subunit [Roseomonas mucosa]